MSFDLAHIWATMGGLSKAIAAVLLLMGIASVAVTVERLLALSRSAKESRIFARSATPIIDEWRIEEMLELSQKHKPSALARLFGFVTERYLRGYQDLDGGMTPVELARNEAERRKEAIGAELRRGLGVLASVGSVAPFVGLLGTVVGIIGAFQGIAATGSGGLAAVSAGIAEALIETALGLLVAIPAVLLFNYLTNRINSVEMALSRSAGELLDEMENHYGRKAESGHKKQAA
jgi:biopolymer transport protein ExbB